MLSRYSSRRAKQDKSFLGQSFLNEKLKHAISYDRIAGYFSPSILQVAGEALDAIPKTRMICNSQISFPSIAQGDTISETGFKSALWQEWCSLQPEKLDIPGKLLEKLFYLLDSKRLQVKILPDDFFGLIHGKAGIITYRDGSKTSFMGSANESMNGWKLNYEIVWEDDSEDSIQWIQDEFNALWGHHAAFPLTRDVILDIQRNANRRIQTLTEWTKDPDPASPIVETPVYRKQNGLWNHQKYFVHRAFYEHRTYGGARLVLADQVGLGKTLQLAMAAQLMALYGDLPILILAPKTLLKQWQDELKTFLDVPSATWNGLAWEDENGIEYEKVGIKGIKNCPRKIGLISQGLIFRKGEACKILLSKNYECIIVDEAHRARRSSFAPGCEDIRNPEVNNLMDFLMEISPKTKSMLLATATPVQIHPIEAWDFLKVLSLGANDRVLGNIYSNWSNPRIALESTGEIPSGLNEEEFWKYLSNPFPPSEEETREGRKDFQQIRKSLDIDDNTFFIPLEYYNKLKPPDKQKIKNLKQDFFHSHNPFIRHIIRRTRSYLEDTLDPETNRPYLDKVAVQLFGEAETESVELPSYLEGAYNLAREYCESLAESGKGNGFLQTLLLRRIGSSMEAGKRTVEKLLNTAGLANQENEQFILADEEDNDADENPPTGDISILLNLKKALEINQAEDPKFKLVYSILTKGISGTERWMDRGCILFSGYYDTAYWIASRLSEEIGEIKIGLYAGSNKSGIFQSGRFIKTEREEIKSLVKKMELKIVVGTDAASEGLNLQSLGSLINIDLPWNPTRLEQRKGRIQRIGQKYEKVYIYNMRYRGSVEDDVHSALSERLESIHRLFGQIPDTLEDVWIKLALGKKEEANRIIGKVPDKHPFEIRYNKHANVPGTFWEQCSAILNNVEKMDKLKKGWS